MESVLYAMNDAKTNKIGRVFSYLRFSSEPQQWGDSERRQESMAKEWCRRHARSLSEGAFADRGVSGWKDDNRKNGALGALLKAVQPGDTILVEDSDRWSRESPLDSLNALRDTVNQGIEIVFLKTGVTVTKSNFNDPATLFPAFFGSFLANAENEKKSFRIRQAMSARRGQMEQGKAVRGRLPAWLDWDVKQGVPVVNEAKAKIVRRMFDLCLQGYGLVQIERMMKDVPPITQRDSYQNQKTCWNTFLIHRTFTDKSVLGSSGRVAQDGSDPGRVFVAGSNPSSEQNTNAFQPLFQPQFNPVTQGSGAIAEQITPDIQTLAGNLGYDPTRIFNYVHDQIKYVHYFGSLKGAELTLLERSGNDFDQCALLSALLQASGYSPGYQFGYLEMPYDNPTNYDVHHWLGLSLQNTNFADTTLDYFNHLLGSRGFFGPWAHFTGDTNTLILPRVWVTLATGGTNYYLDPAFKVSLPVSGISLSNAMNLSVSALTNAAGGTDTGSSVSGLKETDLRAALKNCNSNLLSYISNNVPDATVAQVIGGQQIVSSVGQPLQTSLRFSVFTNSSYPIVTWTNQPTNFMSTFSVSFGGTNKTWFTPELEGKRVSLTFDTNGLGQLWLDDSNVVQTSNTGTSNTLPVTLTARHPYGDWNSTLNIPVDTGLYDQTNSSALYQRTNSSYAIMYGFEASPQWLQERQKKLDAYRAAGHPDTSREVTTETLNVMGLGWMVQTELSHELLSQEWGQLPHHHHRFGRMGQEKGKGYFVDVYLQQDATFPSTGYGTSDQTAQYQVFDVSSYIWSAMEHGIIEQLQSSNLVAASTVKMLQIANTNSQTIYLASSANWSSIRGSLINYGATTNTLNNLISQGFILLLPQNGSNHVAGTGTWAGTFNYPQIFGENKDSLRIKCTNLASCGG